MPTLKLFKFRDSLTGLAVRLCIYQDFSPPPFGLGILYVFKPNAPIGIMVHNNLYWCTPVVLWLQRPLLTFVYVMSVGTTVGQCPAWPLCHVSKIYWTSEQLTCRIDFILCNPLHTHTPTICICLQSISFFVEVGFYTWYVSVYLLYISCRVFVFCKSQVGHNSQCLALVYFTSVQCMDHIMGTQFCTSSYRVFLYCWSKIVHHVHCTVLPIAHGLLYFTVRAVLHIFLTDIFMLLK